MNPRPIDLDELTPTLLGRFLSKVDKSAGPLACLPWLGAKRQSGHGTFNIGNRHYVLAHRLAYELEIGPIPEKLYLRHRCNRGSCCNPAHLLPGTQAENVLDMVQSGRHWRMRAVVPKPTEFRSALAPQGRPVAERFWEKVDKTNPSGCWIWRGSRMKNGYGRFGLGKGVVRFAHRVAYELVHGEASIPPEMILLHSCPAGDRPDCVNPAHLRPGTAVSSAM
jgi:hypothetical protein